VRRVALLALGATLAFAHAAQADDDTASADAARHADADTPRVDAGTAPVQAGVPSARPSPAVAPRPDDGEVRRARATANRIEREWPLAGSGPIASYLRKLGAKLAVAAGPTPYPWRFVVVRNRAANAFAIGAGRIYVYDGVILATQNEAEVAAILAHEMGHQQASHFRAAAPASEPEARVELGGAVTQRIDPAREREADRLGLAILAAAGFDPHAALTLALRLQSESTAPAHLRDPERIASLRAALEAYPPGGRLDSDAYRTLRAHLAER
jgi:predicted Zn-dependent protease